MSDWSEGYVTEIDYTYGYYKEMAPASIRFALHAAGFEAPPLDRFSYCELGFGQGAGLNLLAAAYPQGDFWGTDFNPAHAAGAQKMARACGLANLHVFDDNFEQFRQRELPKFDYIALHGIWSWVSAEHRRQIVDFIADHLKVGGVVYMSYNTLPGWSHALPMRGLLSQYFEEQASPGASLASRFDGALKLLTDLQKAPGSYFMQTPQLNDRIKQLQSQNKNYLAHEYLNRHWTPMFFSQAVEELAPAKLSFAAHANALNCVDALNHSPELQAVLSGISNPLFKEMVRDYGVNQAFRRDLHVRGPRKLTREEHGSTILDSEFALAVPRRHCGLKIRTQVGEAQLAPAVYDPLLDAFAKGGVHSGRTMLGLPAFSDTGGPSRLIQALVVLVGCGYLQPCVPKPLAKAAEPSVSRFNQYVIGRSTRTADGEMLFLASAPLGSGVPQPRLSQLMLRAMSQDSKLDAVGLARSLWGTLQQFGQQLTKDGKTIEGPEANLAELQSRAAEWLENDWPLAKLLRLQ